MDTAARRQVDVVRIVDSSSVGAVNVIVVVLCAGVSFLDGFDILAISYVAPVIGAAWKLPKEVFRGHFRSDLHRCSGGCRPFRLVC